MLRCYRVLLDILSLPLADLHTSMQNAGTLGALLDPTAYIKNAKEFRQDERTVEMLVAFDREIRESLAQEDIDPEKWKASSAAEKVRILTDIDRHLEENRR